MHGKESAQWKARADSDFSEHIFTEEMSMKKINFSGLSFLVLVGAITAFLWLPLVPIFVPLVAVALAMKGILAYLFRDSTHGRQRANVEHLHLPAKKLSKNQAQPTTAWPSLANLPSPARADSLPFIHKLDPRAQRKSFRRLEHEERDRTRVRSVETEFELRKQGGL